MSSLFERLKQRKIVQWALAYLAAAFVVFQSIEVMAEPWGIGPGLQRAIHIVLLVGLLVVLILAWYHGEQGRQRASGAELLMITALLTIAGILLSVVRPKGEAATTFESLPAVASDKPAIAVLPFDNFSPNPDDAYFADGMHEEIIAQLSRISALKVISRTSVMQYREARPSVREIAGALGVDYLLEGSARKAGEQVRLTVQLIETGTDDHLWAEEYDRHLTAVNLFDIQDDVARRVAASLAAQLSPDERRRLESRPTDNLAAYELYMLGRYHFHTRLTEGREGLERAADFYGRAIEADSGFALAYSGLASLCGARPYFWHFDPEVSPSARRSEIEAADSVAAWAARKALALDSTSSEAHTALGTVLTYVEHDWDAAEKEFLTAIELNPGDVLAYNNYGDLLKFRRRWHEAVQVEARALELDPLFSIHKWNLAVALWGAGRLSDAAEAIEAVAPLPNPIAMFRDGGTWLEAPPGLYPHVQLYYEMGLSYDDALEVLVEAMVRTGTNPDSARAYERRWRGLDWGSLWVADLSASAGLPCNYCKAIAYERLGRKREAVDALRTSWEIREPGLLFLFLRPSFKTLEDDRRYLELLHAMGLRP